MQAAGVGYSRERFDPASRVSRDVDLDRIPALLPAAGVLLGAAAGLRLEAPHLLLLVALGGGGVALGGRSGRLLAGAGLGLIAAALAAGGPAAAIDPSRPIEAVGRVAGHWRTGGDDASAPFAADALVQRRPGRPRAVARTTLAPLLVLPAGAELPSFGARLRVRGHLRRSPGYANAVPVPPGPWRLRVKSRRLVETEAPPGPLARLASALRERIETAFARAAAAPGPHRGRAPPRGGPRDRESEADGREYRQGHGAAMVRALVLGDPSGVPDRWRRGLRRAGLAHLLAVSGLHVGLVAGLALLVAAPLPMRPRLAAALAAIAAYLLAAGPRPSLLRAALMGSLAAIALVAERRPSGANALAVAAAALALHRPALVDDVGFRLTVSATAGILFLAPALESAWSGGRAGRPRDRPGRRGGVRRLLLAPLAATCGAQLASLPFAAPVFHLVSWTAPASNLVAVPYTALFLAAALGWVAAALASPPAAAALLPGLDLLAKPFGWPAAGPPAAWGTVPAAAPPAASCALAVLLAAWLLRPRRLILLALAVAVVPAWRWGPGLGHRDPPGVELVALDVGQGDAILLRDGRRALLVDGGGWRRGDLGGRVLVPALAGEGIGRLEAAVLTHPDADHCRGLVDLASYLPIGEVWVAAGRQRAGCGAELAAAALGAGRRPDLLAAGDSRRFGRWRLDVLHPPAPSGEPVPRGLARRPNESSLVIAARALGRRVLLTGDVGDAEEVGLILGDRAALAADVLKVAHHGSRSSTSIPFLAAVRPRLALVSAGVGNPYGHPSPETLGRLRKRGIRVLRTDVDGMLHLAWGAGEAHGRPPPEPLRLALGRLALPP